LPKVAEAFELVLATEKRGGADIPTGGAAPHLAGLAHLDTAVTVVDAGSLLERFDDVRNVAALDRSAAPEDQRSISDLMVDQLEFANVLILNKIDLVPADARARLEGLLRALNPSARLICTEHSRVKLDAVLRTGQFSLVDAQLAAGTKHAVEFEL
jgi:G3E family GTPase